MTKQYNVICHKGWISRVHTKKSNFLIQVFSVLMYGLSFLQFLLLCVFLLLKNDLIAENLTIRTAATTQKPDL